MIIYSQISVFFILIILMVAIIMQIITSNNNLYCIVFEHKNRKLWKYFIKNAINFKVAGSYQHSTVLEYDRYKIWVWHVFKVTSVHLEDTCLLCEFDKKMSKKMYNTLKKLGKI